MTSLPALAPFLPVVAGALLLLLVEAFSRREDKAFLGALSVPFLAASGVFAVTAWRNGASAFEGTLVLDRAAVILILAFLLGQVLLARQFSPLTAWFWYIAWLYSDKDDSDADCTDEQ